MSQQPLACLVLAAGKGTRMKSTLAKPLHKIAGRSMIRHALDAVEALSPEKIVVVVSPDTPDMVKAIAPHPVAVQAVVNGTGGAALAAKEHLAGFEGDILIVYGDNPLVTPATLQRMVDMRRSLPAVGLTFAAVERSNPATYGRMVLADDGSLERIVEFKDANESQRAITLCNGGVVCADGRKLFDWLSQIGNDNAQKEYYLTDLPTIARKDNRVTLAVSVPEEDMEGANDRVELARLENLLQNRLRRKHMLNGVTLTHPESVFFCTDTVIGRDVVIGQNVVFGPDVRIADHVEILPFCHIEGADIAEGAHIGPFARLRPGSRIGQEAKVGNFVETKNVRLEKGAKASHLTYLGDADVGENANIGAGTITCNYDGFNKSRTVIGKGAFIGSNAALVAPVEVGDGAYVGAGSTITKSVPANALGVTRAQQTIKDGWAETYRAIKNKKKGK